MKRVAAVVTEYRVRSHADNIVTRLLEGYELHWTTVRPSVRVAALYTDQVPPADISRDLAAAHGVPIYPTIGAALTLGGDALAVDGVVLVGEHGDYPLNARGQKQYPRRRFFEETAAVFRRSGRVAPVFSDKHLAPTWEDAKWMYDTARALGVPFMAGSSVPIAPRWPPLQVPIGAGVEEAVILGHGPLESYGYHVLEGAQALVERRDGFETGVAAVQCLDGDAFWDAWDRVAQQAPSGSPAGGGRPWSKALQDAALALAPHPAEHPREFYARRARAPAGGAGGAAPPSSRERRPSGDGVAFLVEYRDGLRLSVLMLNGYVGKRSVALRLRDEAEPLATSLAEDGPRTGDVRADFVHFSHLAQILERFYQRGRPLYPVERTLLVSGVLDAAMRSRHEGGRRVETPYLGVRYAPPGAHQGAASVADAAP